MALRYLLDTNTVSELVRQIPDQNVIIRLRSAAGEMGIAATTWHELLFGMLRLPESYRRSSIEKFLLDTLQKDFPILSYDVKAARWFAEERARLTFLGKTPAYADGQIAAVAATNNLIMVTRNVDDFANFNELTVENWFT